MLQAIQAIVAALTTLLAVAGLSWNDVQLPPTAAVTTTTTTTTTTTVPQYTYKNCPVGSHERTQGYYAWPDGTRADNRGAGYTPGIHWVPGGCRALADWEIAFYAAAMMCPDSPFPMDSVGSGSVWSDCMIANGATRENPVFDECRDSGGRVTSVLGSQLGGIWCDADDDGKLTDVDYKLVGYG